MLKEIGPQLQDLSTGKRYSKAGNLYLDNTGAKAFTKVGDLLLGPSGPEYKKVGSFYLDVFGPSILLSGFKTQADGRIDLNGWTDSRAASLWLPDHEGIIREVPSGVPAIVDPNTGKTPRVVRNLVSKSSTGAYSDDMTIGWSAANSASIVNATTWTTGATNSYVHVTDCLDTVPSNGQVYVCRAKISVSADCQLRFRIGGLVTNYENVYAADGEFTFSQTKVFTAAGISKSFGIQCNTNGVTITSTEFQIEEVTGATNQNPSEYVAVNASSDGFAYYATENANTVDANGVVTEAVGANLPSYGEWGFAHYPSTTNLYKKSNDYASWSMKDASASTTDVSNWVGPKGEPIHGVILNSGTLIGGINDGGSDVVSASTTYTYSAYVKAGMDSWVLMQVAEWETGYTNYTGQGAWFNLATGTLGTKDAALDSYDIEVVDTTEGIYKISVVFTGDANTALVRCQIYAASADGVTTSTGDGVNVNFYCGHIQGEAHSFTTPIVPTAGSSASRDICSIHHDYTGYFNQSEGTLIFDWVPPYDVNAADVNNGLLSMDSGSIVGPLSHGWSGPKTSDGTNSLEPFAMNSNGTDEYRVAVRWNAAASEMQIGFKNVTASSAWSWSSTATYDGAYPQSGGKYLLFKKGATDLINYCISLAIYNKDMTTAEIEALP